MSIETLTPGQETPAQRASRRNRKVAWVIAIVAVTLLLGTAWSKGTFDNFLWHVGLNAHPCATNGFGATFCGDDLERYNQRIGN